MARTLGAKPLECKGVSCGGECLLLFSTLCCVRWLLAANLVLWALFFCDRVLPPRPCLPHPPSLPCNYFPPGCPREPSLHSELEGKLGLGTRPL